MTNFGKIIIISKKIHFFSNTLQTKKQFVNIWWVFGQMDNLMLGQNNSITLDIKKQLLLFCWHCKLYKKTASWKFAVKNRFLFFCRRLATYKSRGLQILLSFSFWDNFVEHLTCDIDNFCLGQKIQYFKDKNIFIYFGGILSSKHAKSRLIMCHQNLAYLFWTNKYIMFSFFDWIDLQNRKT